MRINISSKQAQPPKDWDNNPHKKSQKDVDARWTKKNFQDYYGYKNNPLTEAQKESNRLKSKTRARVEHVFGFMENSMNSMFFKKIGIKRAETYIGLINLTYNMFRKIQLTS